MAKSKFNPFPTKIDVSIQGGSPFPGPQLFTPHAAVSCKNISFTPLNASTEYYSVGLVFRKNSTGALSPVFDIREVFFHHADLTFMLGPLMTVDQIPQQFFILGTNPNSDDFTIQDSPSRTFNHLEFTDGISSQKPWHFAFFPRNELEPMLYISDKLVISGSVIKFGKVAWQHPQSRVHPGEEYFTLKAEVMVEAPDSANKTTGTGDSIPLPLVSTGQPCPPRWDTFGVVASLSAVQEVYQNIITDGEKVKKVLVNWLQFADRLEAKP